MINRKEQLRHVFEDTQNFYKDNPILAEAVEKSRKNTKLYEADEYPDLPVPDDDRSDGHAVRMQEIRVTRHKSFEAAMALHREFPDKKIAVLNFASASRPGGGVKNGASAQEESLCRCSTLFPTLDRRWLWQKYYDVNRAAKDVIHTDACIYSPGVMICKTDESIPQRMSPEDFVTVDVISCAAPNLRNVPANQHNPETGKPVRMDSRRLFEIHLKRAQHILHIAAANNADILILGAFGCGAFANDPEVVARAYREAVDRYREKFDVIEFAIFCRNHETENYDAFAGSFKNA